jgi:hypothetical protein
MASAQQSGSGGENGVRCKIFFKITSNADASNRTRKIMWNCGPLFGNPIFACHAKASHALLDVLAQQGMPYKLKA